MNYKLLLKTAVKAAKQGGKEIQYGFDKVKKIDFKSFADPVTEFDKKSENIIVNIISKKYPDHDILTEEELSKNLKSDFKWIIDPLDGTVNFIHGIPFVSISIGIEYKKEVIIGVVYNPILNELFYAVKGEGAFLNRKSIKVSTTKEIKNTMVATGFPYTRDNRIQEIIKPLHQILEKYRGLRRLGAASIDLCYVACGRFDAFYEENLKPWDTSAGKFIVEEAGGKVTNYYGDKYSIYFEMILASNGLMHKDMMKLLKDVKCK